MSFGTRPVHPLQSTCWQHVASGKVYWIVRIGKIEADQTEAVIYEDSFRNVWVRPKAEFMDGRFVQLNSPFASRENPCCEIALGGNDVGPSL